MRKKDKSISLDERIHEVDNKKTFSGVVAYYFEEIGLANHWKADKTRKQYWNAYCNVILPCLEDLKHPKTIDEYTKEDYDEAMEKIKYTGQNPVRTEADLQRFRHLIKVVVLYASKLNLCSNVLWGTAYMVDTPNDPEEKSEELVKLKKSLTPLQEINIYKALTESIEAPGEYFGILLMFALGLRNGEACAADFGDIRTMPEAHDLHVLLVYKTIASKDDKLVSSGKTKNADRALPLPQKIYDILMERKQYISEQKGITLEEVDSYTIACKDNQFDTGCKPDDLSTVARNLFQKAGVKGEVLAYIDVEILDSKKAGGIGDPLLVREKDPTAYLFRRNFATHLHIVGCTEAEIKYLMGHDIEERYESRNEFINLEKLEELKRKMDERAIFKDYPGNLQNEVMTVKNGGQINMETTEDGKLSFMLPKGFAEVRITADEPGDKLEMKIQSENPIIQPRIIRLIKGCYKAEFYDERNYNVLPQYHNVYKTKLARVNKSEAVEDQSEEDNQYEPES